MGVVEIVSVIIAVIGASGGVWGLLAQRNASKTQKFLAAQASRDQKESARMAAEAAAFNLAREHYVKIIDELEEHVSWLKKELAERTEQNAELRQRIAELDKSIANLKEQLEIAVKALANQSAVMVAQTKNTEDN